MKRIEFGGRVCVDPDELIGGGAKWKRRERKR